MAKLSKIGNKDEFAKKAWRVFAFASLFSVFSREGMVEDLVLAARATQSCRPRVGRSIRRRSSREWSRDRQSQGGLEAMDKSLILEVLERLENEAESRHKARKLSSLDVVVMHHAAEIIREILCR